MKDKPKSRMTKQEKQMASMLNYFEIGVGSDIDEVKSPEETKQVVDKFRQNYSRNMLEDLINKLRGGADASRRNEDTEEDDARHITFDSEIEDDTDDENTDESSSIIDELNQLYRDAKSNGMSREEGIQKFVDWVGKVLKSGNADVMVANDGAGVTQIIIREHKDGGKRK